MIAFLKHTGKISFKLSILIFLNLAVIVVSAYAQNKQFSGTVICRQTGLPVEGVSISYSAKNIGSVTNTDGKFIVAISGSFNAKDSLVFSCIGFKNTAISLNDISSPNNIKIQLDTLNITLHEVVVKPLSTREMLDSLIKHNTKLFASPMQLSGYYRELVFTNNACTEFSDALCSYYFSKTDAANGQLKIEASRCRIAKSVSDDNDKTYEDHIDSKINPNRLFRYALLKGLFEKYLPDDAVSSYKYSIETIDSDGSIRITFVPKSNQSGYYFGFVFIVTADFSLNSLTLSIPVAFANAIKEKSLLGIHFKPLQLLLTVNYGKWNNSIYPANFKVNYTAHLWGKLLGTSMDEVINQRSEFVTGNAAFENIAASKKASVYKKGNICGNGDAMNDELLKGHTFIQLSAKDSLAVKPLN